MNAAQQSKLMGIGQVARHTGVSIQTLRYYERRGLLKEVARRPSSYRVYTKKNVHIVNFIKRAQELGFTLTEIEELLWMQSDRPKNRAQVRSMAKAKIDDIVQKINSLRMMKRSLTLLFSSCSSTNSTVGCPILEALNKNRKREEKNEQTQD